MPPIDRGNLATLVESRVFSITITVVIVINAISLGLETSKTAMAAIGPWLRAIDTVALWVFTLELGLKLAAWRGRFSILMRWRGECVIAAPKFSRMKLTSQERNCSSIACW